MENQNFFALLGDNENDAPTLIANYKAPPAAAAAGAADDKAVKKAAADKATPAKLPTKPLPPSEAVKESQRGQKERSDSGGRGRGRRDGYTENQGENGERGGYAGRGRGSYFRERPQQQQGEENGQVEYGSRGRGRGGRFGGRGRGRRAENYEENQEAADEGLPEQGSEREGLRNPRDGPRSRPFRPGTRMYDRRSGTGRGAEMKREGSGRGNWGTTTDAAPVEAEAAAEAAQEETTETTEEKAPAADAPKEEGEASPETKEPEEEEDKEMSLDEYEKVMEEKRKALLALKKSEERKVEADKEFEKMQLVSKKSDEELFIKLGAEKEKPKKSDKEEKFKKSVNINEFLKTDKENSGGYGRGRGRGGRFGYRGGPGGGRGGAGYNGSRRVSAPPIEDPAEFPKLGGVSA